MVVHGHFKGHFQIRRAVFQVNIFEQLSADGRADLHDFELGPGEPARFVRDIVGNSPLADIVQGLTRAISLANRALISSSGQFSQRSSATSRKNYFGPGGRCIPLWKTGLTGTELFDFLTLGTRFTVK